MTRIFSFLYFLLVLLFAIGVSPGFCTEEASAELTPEISEEDQEIAEMLEFLELLELLDNFENIAALEENS